MTDEPAAAIPDRYSLRRLADGDAPALMRFYNGLSDASKRLFGPIGLRTDLDACETIVRDNRPGGDKYDLVAMLGDEIVGWCFIWGMDGPEPALGLGVADGHQGRGLGRSLMNAAMTWARDRRLPAVRLTVVAQNAPARRLYEAFGFVVVRERVSDMDQLLYADMIADLRPSSGNSEDPHG